jgi:quercetin dioxygenase-like cupin family protein
MTDQSPATVFSDIGAEVDIPKDGTISRVVYNDDQIRVVVFGFDTDQELTEHATPLAAIVQVTSGRLHMNLGTDTVEIGAGSWVRMEPGLLHTVRALEPSVIVLSMLKATAG